MWVKVLVLWHVFCITVWSCPKPNNDILAGKVHVAPLAVGDWIRLGDERYLKPLVGVRLWLFSTGAWQYWDMFAPNPANIDWYADAIIHYKDGTERISLYPRIYTLPIPQKYVEERFRKFFERAHSENEYPYIFQQFCYRQALLNFKDPKNPPVRVELRRHWKEVPDPGLPEPKEYHQAVYFTGEIDPQRLKEMAGMAK